MTVMSHIQGGLVAGSRFSVKGVVLRTTAGAQRPLTVEVEGEDAKFGGEVDSSHGHVVWRLEDRWREVED